MGKLTLSLLVCFSALAQPWSGILPTNQAMDWSQSGATIAARTGTPCQTLNSTATAAQITSALTACSGAAVPVVKLNAGTYNLTQTVIFPTSGNVTLRGAGASLTNLHWTTMDNSCGGMYPDALCISNGNTDAWMGAQPNNANWTAGYAQGTASLTFGSMAAGSISTLGIGRNLFLSQTDDASDPGANPWMCQTTGSNGTCSQQGAGGTAIPGRAETETVRVTSLCGNTTSNACSGAGPYTIGISPGVNLPNVVSGKTPRAFWSATAPISNVGVEDLTLDASALPSGNWDGITYFWNAYNCWVTGIRSRNSTISGGSINKQVWMFLSLKMTVRDSYFYGSSPSSEGYGVDFGPLTSDSLAENNIFQHVAAGAIMESAGTGNVFGYNYMVDSYYSGGTAPTFCGGQAGQPCAPNWQGSDSNHHQAGDVFGLWEGHEGIMFRGDNIHGSSFGETVFRSYFNGRDPTLSGCAGVSPSLCTTAGGAAKNMNTSAVVIESSNHYYHMIGNVLGTGNYHTRYQWKPTSTTECGNQSTAWGSVTWMGYSGDTSIPFSIACGGGSFDIGNDLSVATTTMWWGNTSFCTGDAACNTPRWLSSEVPYQAPIPVAWQIPVPATQTLPPSFYRAAKPSFWGTMPWPSIGPDVSAGAGDISAGKAVASVGGHVYHNPAANMYLNVMGGLTDGSSGFLSFDPTLYYQSAPTATTTISGAVSYSGAAARP